MTVLDRTRLTGPLRPSLSLDRHPPFCRWLPCACSQDGGAAWTLFGVFL